MSRQMCEIMQRNKMRFPNSQKTLFACSPCCLDRVTDIQFKYSLVSILGTVMNWGKEMNKM